MTKRAELTQCLRINPVRALFRNFKPDAETHSIIIYYRHIWMGMDAEICHIIDDVPAEECRWFFVQLEYQQRWYYPILKFFGLT